MRLLLDAGVLVDFFFCHQSTNKDVLRLLIMREFGDAELWVSANSFSHAFKVLSSQVDVKKTTHSKKSIQSAFKESLNWLDVCSIEGRDIKNATETEWIDFESCMDKICAKKVKADYVITHDVSRFDSSKIPALSPKDFFEMMEAERGLVYDEIDLCD